MLDILCDNEDEKKYENMSTKNYMEWKYISSAVFVVAFDNLVAKCILPHPCSPLLSSSCVSSFRSLNSPYSFCLLHFTYSHSSTP